MKLLHELSLDSVVMGMLAAFVGFAGSFAIVLQGLLLAGATTEQAAAALMVLSVGMGVCGIYTGFRTRMPVSIAWSTPGAALLATTGVIDGGFSAVVGGFVICGVLLTLSGAWPLLGRAVSSIPGYLANAMLAGVLFGLCLAPVQAVAEFPLFGVLLVATWVGVGLLNRLMAVPAALAVFALISVFGIPHADAGAGLWTSAAFKLPELITPTFTLPSLVSIGVPLFIVTMASQNIPGVALLRAKGYEPDAGPLFTLTGVFSTIAAFFGGHAINLAAITGALCAGEEAHENPGRRYWASIVSGVCYVVVGVFAAYVTALAAMAPPVLLQAVAGLALVGAFSASAMNAFADPDHREAAACTFFTTASGLSFAGVSGAFWGLLVGGLIHWVKARSRWGRA